uniref:Uncharacterized protein tRNA/rRNA methyltransferase SpoU family protein n=1 Tax=Rhizophora mucronata TaxID=61149 RepID=A0A2P2IP76_RHIMU
MDAGRGRGSCSCLKTLKAITPLSLPLHFRTRTSLFRHIYSAQFRNKKPLRHSLSFSQRSSSLVSLSERGNGNSLPLGAGDDGGGEVLRNKLLQVVLVSPQIPGNTGCIARTCAASAVGLHLVGPLGFQIDDTKLKRAGLDYWPYPCIFHKCHSFLFLSFDQLLVLLYQQFI